VTDFVAPLIPLGSRLWIGWATINGELWGRVTDPGAPWAVLFPQAADEDKAWMASHAQQALARSLAEVHERTGMLPRHPSQLYEVGLEGLALFALLWLTLAAGGALGR
jgi:phosphatidylglycerol:prolipoprotein diacylglycerol transferase